MNRIGEFLGDHLRAVLIVLIAVIGAVIIAIAVSVISGGDTDRSLVISDITGNVFIMKNDGQIPAVRNMVVSSGDLVVTAEGSSVKLKTDNGKFIYIEPTSTVYVYYTKKSNKGSIIVNISDGSVLCRLDSKLTNSEVFEVRTPNSVNSVSGTVFHVDFNYYEELGAYRNVMLTDVKCLEGAVSLQLYDISGNKVKAPEQLMQGNAAEMLSADGNTAYNYLNQPFALSELNETALQNLIKASAERTLPFSLADLNDAYVTVKSRSGSDITVPIVTAPVTENIFTQPSVSEKESADSQETSSEYTEYSQTETEYEEYEETFRVTVPEDVIGTTAPEVTEDILTAQDTSASQSVTAQQTVPTVTSAPVTAAPSEEQGTSVPSSASETQPSLHIYTVPTTAATTSAVPVTTSSAAPVTAAPVTAAPVTAAPVTAAPVTAATSTAPVTSASASQTTSPHTVFTVPENTRAETVYTSEQTSAQTTPTPDVTSEKPAQNWWEIVNSENN